MLSFISRGGGVGELRHGGRFLVSENSGSG